MQGEGKNGWLQAVGLAAMVVLGSGCGAGVDDTSSEVSVPSVTPSLYAAGGGNVELVELSLVGVEQYFAQNPIPTEGLRLQFDKKKHGNLNVSALLRGIPEQIRERVVALELPNARLKDDDLPVLASFSKVTELNLRLNLMLSPARLAKLVRALPELRSLDIGPISGKSADEHVRQLAIAAGKKEALQKLKKLSLSKNQGILPETLYELLVSLPKLNDLDLSYTTLSREHGEKLMEGASEKLKNLDLSGVDEAKLEILPELLEHFKQIEMLSLIDVEIAEEPASKQILLLPEEEGKEDKIMLNLSGYWGLPPDELVKRIKRYAHLHTLNLSYMGLTNAHVDALVQLAHEGWLNELRELQVCGTHACLSLDRLGELTVHLHKNCKFLTH